MQTCRQSTQQARGRRSTTVPRTTPLNGGGDALARVQPAAVPSSNTAPPGRAARGAPSRRQPRPFNPVAVLADLEAGHDPLTLRRATKERCLWTRGHAPHVAVLYRAAQPTQPHPLETALVNGLLVVTKPALMRWLARNNQRGELVVQAPQNEQRRRERVDASLDALGLK